MSVPKGGMGGAVVACNVKDVRTPRGSGQGACRGPTVSSLSPREWGLGELEPMDRLHRQLRGRPAEPDESLRQPCPAGWRGLL